MAAALQGLVPCVVGQIIVLVLLEQITGLHLIAALHQSLDQITKKGRRQITKNKTNFCCNDIHDYCACLNTFWGLCNNMLSLVFDGESKQSHLLSNQQSRALQGHSHHFMRVPGHRISPKIV